MNASRAVTVASNLLQPDTKATYAQSLKAEYDKLREGYLNRSRDKKYHSIGDARENKFRIDWKNYQPVKPSKIGVEKVEVELSELVPYIDWTPFFQSWQLFGKYPAILEDEIVGNQAISLLKMHKKCSEPLLKKSGLQQKVLWGFFKLIK